MPRFRYPSNLYPDRTNSNSRQTNQILWYSNGRNAAVCYISDNDVNNLYDGSLGISNATPLALETSYIFIYHRVAWPATHKHQRPFFKGSPPRLFWDCTDGSLYLQGSTNGWMADNQSCDFIRAGEKS